MRICFVVSSLDVNDGNGRFAHGLINSLRDLGIDITTVTIKKTKISFFGFKFFLNSLLVAKAAMAEKADVVHALDAWPRGIVAYLANLLTGIPFGMTIYATYGVEPLTRFPHSILLKSAYKKSVLNAAISHITAKKITDKYPKADIKVINQGIKFSDYQSPIKHKRVTENPYILTVAYMKARKGYETAIPVFARLKKDFPELKYVIRAPLSNESYHSKIQKLIEELGIGQDIIWLPRLEENELIDVYKHAKIFFLPSVSSHPLIFEGFGSVYVEAEACGIPVVTSRGGGQEDAMIDGKTGFLVDEGSIEQGYQAIKKLLENKNLYSEFSENAKKFAQSMDWQYKAKEYYDYYQNELKSPLA